MSETLILWTGGWDSTFRVLDLLIYRQTRVRPYYLIDNERRGSEKEMATMEAIRRQLEQEFPEAHARLLPLETVSRHDIPEDPVIASAYQRVREKQQLGSQYEWLSRFCQFQGIRDIELSIEQDIKERRVVSGARAAFEASVIPVESDAGLTYRVSPDRASQDELILFGPFSFPLLYTTKIEMGVQANERGFRHILEKAWFCHAPIHGQACGRCPPCRLTIENGMGYRLPFVSRYIRYPLRKLEKWLEQCLPQNVLVRLRSVKSKLHL